MKNKLLAAFFTLTAVGCGSPKDPGEYTKYDLATPNEAAISNPMATYSGSQGSLTFKNFKNPEVKLTPQEEKYAQDNRAQFCATYVAGEPDASVREAFIRSISGYWEVSRVKQTRRKSGDGYVELSYPSWDENGIMARRKFYLDLRLRQAGANGGGLFSKLWETMQYQKICVSSELAAPAALAGYRLIELAATDGEGVAGFFAKIQGNTLLMTLNSYDRYGQKNSVKSLSETLSYLLSGSAPDLELNVFVYPNHTADLPSAEGWVHALKR